MNKYQLYCETDGKHEHVIATTEPTLCPVNGAHTVKAGSVILVKEGVLVNDGSPKDLPLADYKQLRYNEIDGKSVALVSAGFTYDSQTFSLSANAQDNWNALKNQTSEFTWPKDISTKDNNSYSLAEANVTAFWTAGKDFIDGILDGGRTLKKSVFDAVDEAAVDAIVDNR